MAIIDNKKTNSQLLMTTENLNLLVSKINNLITFTNRAEAKLFDPDMIDTLTDEELQERYDMAFTSLYKLLEYLRRCLGDNISNDLQVVATSLLNLPPEKMQRLKKLINSSENTDDSYKKEGKDIEINL